MLYSNMHIETLEAENLPKIIANFQRTGYQDWRKTFHYIPFNTFWVLNNVNVLIYLKKLNLKIYKLNDNNKNKIQTIYYLKKYLLNE